MSWRRSFFYPAAPIASAKSAPLPGAHTTGVAPFVATGSRAGDDRGSGSDVTGSSHFDPVACSCELTDPDGLGECRTCRRLVVATVAIAASGSPAAVPAGAGADPEAAIGVAVAKADGPATAAPSSA